MTLLRHFATIVPVDSSLSILFEKLFTLSNLLVYDHFYNKKTKTSYIHEFEVVSNSINVRPFTLMILNKFFCTYTKETYLHKYIPLYLQNFVKLIN